MFTFAVLGLGSRGIMYGTRLSKQDDVRVVACCDKYANKVEIARQRWGVPENNCFTSDEEFFAQGKLADAIVIATQDRDHYAHAMRALDLGYNILVEKPLSPDINECLELEAKAREKGLKVLVCHVLRYSPYYRKIKEIIASGVLGDIVAIKHDENVSYWHYAHSYCRGNWRREEETSPMLLAKCCHDMDLLHWWTGSDFKTINSYGDLRYFKAENAPEGATDSCFDCPNRKKCYFDAQYYYVGRRRGIIKKRKFLWGTYAFCQSKKKSDIINSLKNDPRGKLWARCVFKCDNDVVDNQTVNILFENGAKCVFTMNAFNEKNHRHTEIRGTKGELYADDKGNVMTLRLFDKPAKKIRTSLLPMISGHAGGDAGLIKSAVGMLTGGEDKSIQYTWISDTIESHRMVTAAELSRHEGGRAVSSEEILDIK